MRLQAGRSDSSGKNGEYGQNYFKGNITSDNDSFMIVSIPYEEGWKIRVNEEEVNKYKVNGGCIGFPISSGLNTIEMYYTPKGFKIGCISSLIGIVMLVIICIEERKNRKV